MSVAFRTFSLSSKSGMEVIDDESESGELLSSASDSGSDGGRGTDRGSTGSSSLRAARRALRAGRSFLALSACLRSAGVDGAPGSGAICSRWCCSGLSTVGP